MNTLLILAVCCVAIDGAIAAARHDRRLIRVVCLVAAGLCLMAAAAFVIVEMEVQP